MVHSKGNVLISLACYQCTRVLGTTTESWRHFQAHEIPPSVPERAGTELMDNHDRPSWVKRSLMLQVAQPVNNIDSFEELSCFVCGIQFAINFSHFGSFQRFRRLYPRKNTVAIKHRIQIRNSTSQHETSSKKSQRNCIAPISRLPIEVMEEIFLSVQTPTTLVIRYGDTAGPWIFGKVSRVWRQIALSLSKLWCDIRLELDSTIFCPDHRATNRLLRILELVVHRSGGVPITFEIHAKSYTLIRYTIDVLKVLSAASLRWKTISLNTGHLDYMKIFQPFMGEMPLLESLNLKMSFIPLDISPYEVSFQGASALKSITLDLKDFSCLSALNLPWHQITNFTFDSSSIIDNNLDVLQQMANLIHLSVCVRPRHRNNTFSLNQISLFSVRVLTLTHLESSRPILQNMKLPYLEELQIFEQNSEKGLDIRSLVESLSCLPKRLVLNGIVHPTALLDSVEMLPTIGYLRLNPSKSIFLSLDSRCKHFSPLISHLTTTRQDEGLPFPDLRMLILDHFPPELFSRLMDLVKVRISERQDIQLHAIRLNYCDRQYPYPSRDIVATFSQHMTREAGVSIEWHIEA